MSIEFSSQVSGGDSGRQIPSRAGLRMQLAWALRNTALLGIIEGRFNKRRDARPPFAATADGEADHPLAAADGRFALRALILAGGKNVARFAVRQIAIGCVQCLSRLLRHQGPPAPAQQRAPGLAPGRRATASCRNDRARSERTATTHETGMSPPSTDIGLSRKREGFQSLRTAVRLSN